MTGTNPYEPQMVELTEVVTETPTIKTFVVHPDPVMPFRAGQFVQLTVPGVGEAPFTPAGSPSQPERLELTVIRTGQVTDILHTCRPGTELGLRGPFGKGYPVDQTVGKDVLIVGGGCGLAPLRSLIYTLLERIDNNAQPPGRMVIKYGARSSDELVYRQEYEKWASRAGVQFECTIDFPEPAWTGKVGVVTTLLETPPVDIGNAIVFSCGPEVMLKFVTLKLIELGFKPEQLYLSMNRRMSCGMGKCGRCNIGPYYLCKDGPDICYAKIKDYANAL